jgi:hypothetical protein
VQIQLPMSILLVAAAAAHVPSTPQQNMAAASITLTREEEQELRASVRVLQGNRYPPDSQGSTFNTRL